MVKLSDVARHAGVGVGTASRALTGRGYVEAGTRERVLASADALSYRPNAVARALREQRTGVVGLVLPDLANEFYTESAAVLQAELAQAGRQLLVASSRNDVDTETEVLRTMVERQVDGLVHVPIGSTPPPEGVPTVQLNRWCEVPGVVAVLSDDRAGVAGLTRAVLVAGHTRLAVIGGPSDLSTSRDRLAGFRDAAAEAGVRPRELEAPFTAAGGTEAMRALLEDLPEALVVLSARVLMGVLRVCHEQGVDLPGQVSLAAFGNPDWYGVCRPAVTSFAPPLEEMGRRAAHELQRLMTSAAGPADGGGENGGEIRLPGRLVVRDSVASRRDGVPA